ncbi:hypothetical protein DICPUDRAFT_96754 [Dictyostelium purpureum]|uniref:Phosphatidylinositol 3-kinase n=1 Tax=Dictyostelium purpureum TaxID=5786 RepID=F0ZAX6_DICPU|nr:uncharacterized protein DICPUDRAFT_96754 [Dictyostelium purpureum]EGC38875.1 hypothetical protein DICPUDRAFT_96754 [Dictyostelium purpureum]|eukprot:XP_003284555.1 hypothetical protein DICPUDRAFT_96754 [Dictyostelium purpureum]
MDYICIITLPNGRTININITNETSVQQLKNQILAVDSSLGSNFLLSLSSDFNDTSQIIKAVGWTKLLSIEQILKQTLQNKPKERKKIILYIVPSSSSPLKSPSPLSSSPLKQSTGGFLNNNSFNNNNSGSNSSIKNSTDSFKNENIEFKSTKEIIESLHNNIANNNNNNVKNKTNIKNPATSNLRKSKSDIRFEEYWKAQNIDANTSNSNNNRMNNNNNNNSNDNSVSVYSGGYNEFVSPQQTISSPSTNVKPQPQQYSYKNNNPYQIEPNVPGQIIYQPSTFGGGSNKATLTYKPKSSSTYDNKPSASTVNANPSISISPPTNSTKATSNKLENLDLNLLDEMVGQISINNQNQTKSQKKRSSSFSSHFSTFIGNTVSSKNSSTIISPPINNNENYYQPSQQYLSTASSLYSNDSNSSSNSSGYLEPIGQRQRGSSVSSVSSNTGGNGPCFTQYYSTSLRESPIIYSGELYKKNRNLVGWKKRYFILTSTKLLYANSSNETPKSELLLSDYVLNIISDSSSKYFCFQLTPNTSGGLLYLFGIEDLDQHREWINAITNSFKCLDYNIPIDASSLPNVTLSQKKHQTLEIDYYKKLPSEIKVAHQNDEINYFRFKMSRLLKLIQQYTFKSNNLILINLNSNNSYSPYNQNVGKQQSSQATSTMNNTNFITTVSSTLSIRNASNSVKLENVKVENQITPSPTALAVTATNTSNSINSNRFIKVMIYHNGLVIKYSVNINSTFEMILNERVDLFGENASNKYGFRIVGSLEHIFNLKIQLKDSIYVEKALRFRKKFRLQTIDVSLQSRLFIPNVMTSLEWKQLEENINLNDNSPSSTKQSNNTLSSSSALLVDLTNSKKQLPKSLLDSKLVISIVSLENILPILKRYYPNSYNKISIYIEIQILYGDVLLCKNKTSCKSNILEWNEQLYFDINMLDFPKECTFLTSVYSNDLVNSSNLLLAQFPYLFQSVDNKKIIKECFEIDLLPIYQQSQSSNGPVSSPSLLQQQRQSSQSLSVLLNSSQNPILKCKIPNILQSLYFQEISSNIINGNNSNNSNSSFRKQTITSSLTNENVNRIIESLMRFDRSLVKESHRLVLWENRHYCKLNFPNILPTLLYNFSFLNYSSRVDLYDLLKDWPILSPEYGIELLSSDFIDDRIREKGVVSINQWDDNQLSLYLPQIVSMIKYESNNFSSLACFIVKRAICNPLKIGEPVFWLCSNEINLSENKIHIVIRYRLIMEIILEGLGIGVVGNNSSNNTINNNQGRFGQSLLYQYLLIQLLKQINLDIIKEPEKQKQIFETRLASIPKVFSLPTHPFQEFNGFILEELKVKDSNAAPLWLVFSSVDPHADDTKIIFKKDDVRPDELCLQLFSVMDSILKSNGLDCEFTIFKCMSVGSGLGLIEVVPNSVTLADFMRDTTKYPSIEQWLRQKNPHDSSYKDIFLKSLSAYCVATYLLGIYDRHNDNLMVSETGNFFHIDFGYFLGKVTKFFMFERETAPFVLTKDLVQMIGSKENEFKQLCCKIYNILRENSRQLLNLITSNNGKQLVQERLKLDLTNEQAEKYFLYLIKESKGNTRAEINNIVHVLVHPN